MISVFVPTRRRINYKKKKTSTGASYCALRDVYKGLRTFARFRLGSHRIAQRQLFAMTVPLNYSPLLLTTSPPVVMIAMPPVPQENLSLTT